jgi:hypothetical protein
MSDIEYTQMLYEPQTWCTSSLRLQRERGGGREDTEERINHKDTENTELGNGKELLDLSSFLYALAVNSRPVFRWSFRVH